MTKDQILTKLYKTHKVFWSSVDNDQYDAAWVLEDVMAIIAEIIQELENDDN